MRRFCYLLVLVFSISCDERQSEEGALFITLEPFHTVELNSVFDVFLVQDSVYGIRIEAAENLLKDVAVKIDSGIVRITNQARVKWLTPQKNKVRVFIHANRLRELWPNETCRIETVNPIIADEFRIVMGHHPKLAELDLELNNLYFYYWNNHQCGGKMTLRGKTNRLAVFSYALMSVDATALTAENAVVENNSKGDCKVHVRSALEYSIRGVGNIYLSGQPGEIIQREVTSSGRLIEVE